MKRLLMLAALCLAAVFLVASPGQAATGTAKSSTSSKVTPKRDKKKSYRFKTTGKIAFPSTLCPPNAPSSGCIALRCPAGVTNAKYCSKPTVAQLCSGKVRIIFKQGLRTRSSKLVSVRSNCTYSSTITIKAKARKLKVSVKFAGNTVLKASKATTKTVRAG